VLRKCQLAGHKRAGLKTKNVLQCLQFAEIAIRQCKHGCEKEERKKEKRETGKDDRMLTRSNLTIFKSIFCGPEWTEEKWELWIHPSTLVPSKFTSTMDRRQQVVVVHGSGRILNRLHKDIMQSSQWLLDALGSQGWNAVAIKGQLEIISPMIDEHHERFTGVWFSGFVRMGQGCPLEMITTRKVHVVSSGGVIQSIRT
jgi:hypothetical protein